MLQNINGNSVRNRTCQERLEGYGEVLLHKGNFLKSNAVSALLIREHRDIRTKFGEFTGLSDRSEFEKRFAIQIRQTLIWHIQIDQ
ncbi:hypothetical protein AAKU67_004152 [Oxalobacteraceae bacterium GrIS 2.11]